MSAVNNEFCYFPLDLNKFSGKINRTRSGLYCASWDGLPDTDNYCVTDPNKQGRNLYTTRDNKCVKKCSFRCWSLGLILSEFSEWNYPYA